jgi:hypothetical protein
MKKCVNCGYVEETERIDCPKCSNGMSAYMMENIEEDNILKELDRIWEECFIEHVIYDEQGEHAVIGLCVEAFTASVCELMEKYKNGN